MRGAEKVRSDSSQSKLALKQCVDVSKLKTCGGQCNDFMADLEECPKRRWLGVVNIMEMK